MTQWFANRAAEHLGGWGGYLDRLATLAAKRAAK
jgi:hypothetical protein